MSVASAAPAVSAVTVREALRLPALRRGLPEVLAGHAQLDRPVRWVHAGEVSNIASLLTGGEMLLTTGMGIGTKRIAQRRFVERLAERRIAALVIELGGVFSELPAALVEAAQAADLPLIALHHEIPFVAVTEVMHTEIVSSHYALLQRGEEIHRQLSGLMLDGEGIPEVLAALASVLGAPVFLEGPGVLLSHATPADYELDPLEVWEAAREAVDGVTVRAAPVRLGRDPAGGRLLVADLHARAGALAQIALGHAADILALALLRDRQEEELVGHERDTFLANLADGRIAPGGVARGAQAAGLGRLAELLLPVAAELRTPTSPTPGDWGLMLRDAHRLLRDRGLDAVLGHRRAGATLLVLVALRDLDQRASAADAVAAALRRAVRERLGAEHVAVAVGRAVPSDAAGDELRLTEESAASAVTLADRPWHNVTELELHRLLWAQRGSTDLAAFVQRAIGPLLDHDQRRKRDLLPTLEALLEHGGHKAETARALHLNRQGLYYRLARIEELLGVDLGDPRQTLTLHVALHARRYVEGLGG
jgi:PucR family transcriptional regulator, purine catabolism regulatory protein